MKKISQIIDSLNIDLDKDFARIVDYFTAKLAIRTNSRPYSLSSYLAKYAFESWPLRGRCTSFEEWLNELNLPERPTSTDDLLYIIQFVLTCMNRVLFVANENDHTINKNTITVIQSNTAQILDILNYTAKSNELETFLIQKDENATAVAELYPEISDKIYEYRRYDLRGDLSKKEEMLAFFAKSIEPRLDKLSKNPLTKQMEDDLRYLFNNFNIRHNNLEGKNKHSFYTELNPDEVELWYDRTYDMFLLSMMHLHYLEFVKDIKNSKKIIDRE